MFTTLCFIRASKFEFRLSQNSMSFFLGGGGGGGGGDEEGTWALFKYSSMY